MERKGYSYTLHRIHPDTNKLDIFASSTNGLGGLRQSGNINIANASWTLTVSSNPSPYAGFVGYGILILVVALVAYSGPS